MKKAKKTFMVLLATLFLFSTAYTPAMCEDKKVVERESIVHSGQSTVDCGLSTAMGEDKKAISKEDDSLILIDMAVARPVGLAVTAAGSALFIVFLPFSLVSGNVKDSWNKLVVKPAEYTFKRPLGEF